MEPEQQNIMKPEQQNLAIAEACGGKHSRNTEGCREDNPDYLNSLDAMAAAERWLDDEQYLDFMRYLTAPHDTASWSAMRQALEATSAQRAEAFLKCLNLWQAE